MPGVSGTLDCSDTLDALCRCMKHRITALVEVDPPVVSDKQTRTNLLARIP